MFLRDRVVIPTWDESQYCGRKFQENSLYSQHCPSMASFLPMEARQWGGNLLACRQASKWARRAKVWMFESIISSRLSQSNTSNGKMCAKWPYESLIFHEYLYTPCILNNIKSSSFVCVCLLYKYNQTAVQLHVTFIFDMEQPIARK